MKWCLILFLSAAAMAMPWDAVLLKTRSSCFISLSPAHPEIVREINDNLRIFKTILFILGVRRARGEMNYDLNCEELFQR